MARMSAFLLGFRWREVLESETIDVQRGYVYDTQGNALPACRTRSAR